MLDYAYFAVFIVLTNNGFFCVIEKGINFNRRRLEKASFLQTLYLEKEAKTSKNKYRTVFNTCKRTSMQNLELFWWFSFFAKNR